ncbi:MAG: P-loop NTPase [Spirochaetia bacterium]|nr:P-loop NTPase [Bacteroidota bacterium]MBL7006502.1 P-loop NTPase [Spirochaetia bacterium]
MKDQAESLRQLISGQRSSGTVVIAVSSAITGCGVTTFAVNLAASLMLHDKRVVLLDISDTTFELLGGSIPNNENIVINFLNGDLKLQDILTQTPVGLKVLRHTEVIKATAASDKKLNDQLQKELTKLGEADYIIAHLHKGITKESLPYIAGADQLFLISDPDIESVRDTYGMVKSILQRVKNDLIPDTYFVMNKSLSDQLSISLAERLRKGVQKFLDFHITFAGTIPIDEAVILSKKTGNPVVVQSPHSSAALKIEEISSQIVRYTLKKSDNEKAYSGIRKFIDQIL